MSAAVSAMALTSLAAVEQCTFALNPLTGFRHCETVESESPTTSTLIFRSSGAVSPACFSILHLAAFHLTARAFPAKQFTYPLLAVLNLALYAAEHLTAELPVLAEALPVLAPILFLTFALSFYFSCKRTVSKRSWAAGLACFFVGLGGLVANDLGVPKDAVSEQKLANFEVHYTNWHMVVHIVLVISFGLATAGVPWAAAKPKASAALAPRSPRHTTLSPGRVINNTISNIDCASPKRSSARWPKKTAKAE